MEIDLSIESIIEQLKELNVKASDFDGYIKYVSKMNFDFCPLKYYFIRKEIVEAVQYVVDEQKENDKKKDSIIDRLRLFLGTKRSRGLNDLINKAILLEDEMFWNIDIANKENYLEKLEQVKKYFIENNLFRN